MKKIYSLLVICLINFAQSQTFEKLILTQNFELIRANTFFIEKTDDDKLNIQKTINDALFDYNFSIESDKMKANYVVSFSYKYRLNNGCEGRVIKRMEGRIIERTSNNRIIATFIFSQNQFEGKCSREIIYALIKKLNDIAE